MMQKHARFDHTTRLGFTLIELLVVISIISLLVALTLPSLSNARELGMRAKCLAGARQVHVGTMSYAADFRNFGPANYSNPVWPIRSTSHPTYEKEFQVLITDLDYLPQVIFTNKGGCPHGPATFNTGHYGSAPAVGTNIVTYGFNSKLQGGWGFGTNPDNGNVNSNGYYGPLRLDLGRAGRHPHLTGSILDSANPGTHGNGGRDHSISMRRHLGLIASHYHIPDFRHRAEGLNMVYLTGHGEFVPRQSFVDYHTNLATMPLNMRATFLLRFHNYNDFWVDGTGRGILN